MTNEHFSLPLRFPKAPGESSHVRSRGADISTRAALYIAFGLVATTKTMLARHARWLGRARKSQGICVRATTRGSAPSLPEVCANVWRPSPVPEAEVARAMPFRAGNLSPENAAEMVWEGQSVLFDDRWADVLETRRFLNSIAKEHQGSQLDVPEPGVNAAAAHRSKRGQLRASAQRLFVRATVSSGKLNLQGGPNLGYLPALYGMSSSEQIVLRANDIQALNVAWQFFLNGVKYDFLSHSLHPFFGVYFTPTPVDHFCLLREWISEQRAMLLGRQGARALDLGTGCGVISLLLRSEKPRLKVIASDICPNAVFSVQAELLRWGMQGVEVLQSDLFTSLNTQALFDVIIFNPPWIPRLPGSDEERKAGDIGGGNYYPADLFERLFAEAPRFLRPGGHLVILFSDYAEIRGLVESSPLLPFVKSPELQLVSSGVRRRKVAVENRSQNKMTRRDKGWALAREHSVELWDFVRTGSVREN